MKRRRSKLRRRYGHAKPSPALTRYRGAVEIALVPHFERLGVSYWVARDVATDTAHKTHAKIVRTCFDAGVSARDCAARIESELAKRRAR